MHLGLVATSRAEEIVHEHHDLLAAISVGDADRAREVAVSQARAAQRMILEALLDSDAVQSTNLMLVAPRS
jgi:DNA-binding GntR family transcriptional regulator